MVSLIMIFQFIMAFKQVVGNTAGWPTQQNKLLICIFSKSVYERYRKSFYGEI